MECDIQRLALNSLYALSNDLCPPAVIKAAFELRYMLLAGYAPDLDACTVCGNPHPVRPVAMLEGGTVRCQNCVIPGTPGKQMSVGVTTLEAAKYILNCDLKKLFSFQLPEDDLRRLGKFTEAYLLACMERTFRTLDFYKSVGEEP